MIKISKKRFDAYVKFIRNPNVFIVAEEIAWYENPSRTVFGVVLFDINDCDYNSVLLARDINGRIECVNVEASFENLELAESWLFSKAIEFENNNAELVNIHILRNNDLFDKTKSNRKYSVDFEAISTLKPYSAARNLLKEIMPHYFDVDGNFIEQFQTTGFDSRIWELYLFNYFHEEGLEIIKDNVVPDFLLTDGSLFVSVEAVTVGNKNLGSKEKGKGPQIPNADEVSLKRENEMPIRFGSSLYSKLKHKYKGLQYWEQPHTKNNPFIIAIADFHSDFSMSWSQPALQTYLYGYTYTHSFDDKGNLIVHPHKVDSHMQNNKVIPSGFFNQPDSENISAIMSTAVGTISKFSRIGKQCGFDEWDTKFLRTVTYHDHNPNAAVPIRRTYLIDEDCDETWGEGMNIYHNPNALYPTPPQLFPNAAHHFFEDEQIVSYMPEVYPYSSFTMLISEHEK